MKAKGLNTKLYFYGLRTEEKTLHEPDPMNNTVLLINGERVWPVDEPFSPTTIQEGDIVKLEIPSGKLEVVVDSINNSPDYIHVLGEGTWEGRAGGLAGGLSGCCDFDVLEWGTVTESSALEPGREVPYFVYEAVRDAASILNDQYDKQKAMQKMFEALLNVID